ncbi:MAG: hypothetical protein AAF914_15390, partial [Pseudomonadota bacterium]
SNHPIGEDMRLKTLITAFFLALTPAAAFAEGCSWGHIETTSSCAEGATWDAEAGACVPIVSS